LLIEDRIVCLCARQNFNGMQRQQLINICQNNQIAWDKVFNIAQEQHVAPLVHLNLSGDGLQALQIPQVILSKFKKAYIHNIFVKQGTAKILEQVLALFARKGIEVMLIKGEALNHLVYKQPWYTISYDVDLVIKARQDEIDEADHQEIIETLEGFNHQLNEFKEHIEYDYYAHHDFTMNNTLPIDSERIWQEAQKIQVSGYDVFVMTPEDMLIAAAINSCRKRFFRLKSLCDILAIIEQYPDLDWAKLARKASNYKCNTIVYTALVVTQTLLEYSLPNHVLGLLKINPLRAAAIKHLVNKLCQDFSLSELYDRSEGTMLGREFSWPLILTYATYRLDYLGPKLGEIYAAWRNPPPPVPG